MYSVILNVFLHGLKSQKIEATCLELGTKGD